MMIACYQAHDSKPRLLLLSREPCHAHHHPGNHHGAVAEGVPGSAPARRPLARFSPRAQAVVQSTCVVEQAAGEIPMITKSITSGGKQ